jgi:hypothetical protein
MTTTIRISLPQRQHIEGFSSVAILGVLPDLLNSSQIGRFCCTWAFLADAHRHRTSSCCYISDFRCFRLAKISRNARRNKKGHGEQTKNMPLDGFLVYQTLGRHTILILTNAQRARHNGDRCEKKESSCVLNLHNHRISYPYGGSAHTRCATAPISSSVWIELPGMDTFF